MENASWFERGHVAIITGASQGFGRAVAALLAERGLNLVVTARHADALEKAARGLRAQTSVVALAGDVADSAHVHALVDAALGTFGRIDLVVNNASTLGATPLPALAELGPHTFDALFRTNVYAPLHLVQHALPALRRTHGTIVNVTSDAGVNAYPRWGGYGASKAALEHLTRTLGAELEGSGVSLILADPGDMRTEMHRLAAPDDDAASLTPPDSVAPALLDALAQPRGTYLRVELQTQTPVIA